MNIYIHIPTHILIYTRMNIHIYNNNKGIVNSKKHQSNPSNNNNMYMEKKKKLYTHIHIHILAYTHIHWHLSPD